MKNEKENSRKQEGFLWIALGLLLIAAALFITAFNLYDELRAEKASSQAVCLGVGEEGGECSDCAG